MDESPAAPPAVPTDADDRRITPGRVAATVVVLGLVALWVYAFSGLARKDPPDLLDDPSFSQEAEPVCAVAVGAVEALPAAQDAPSPEVRAETVARANQILDEMVADLRLAAPTGADRDSRITGLWLDDWGTYLSDRRSYADALRRGSEDPPEFTPRGNRAITTTIDNFAEVNDMASCATPLDL